MHIALCPLTSVNGYSIPERPTKPNQMGKLHASKFKQSAVSQSYTNHGHFHPSITKAEDPQGKAVTDRLGSCSTKIMTHYYTGNLKCTINMNLLCRRTNMFHPPSPHPLPPEDEQLNYPFSKKYWKSRICIYLHSLSHCRPNGCQFSVSPPPTYSMGSVHKTACAGYSTLIITGSIDWKTQIEK